jgi:hypothetical protein
MTTTAPAAAPAAPPMLDSGKLTYGAHALIKMEPGIGGHVDLSPETVTEMIGCSADTVGACGAALSLESMHITGANVPIDTHVILTTTKGNSINSHSANHINPDGSVTGVHGNIRAGNTRTGLDIRIPLQPHEYTKGGTRAENMGKALATQKNWKEHKGSSEAEILKSSTVEVKTGMAANGVTHTRILADRKGPIGKLIGLNPNSEHPIMKVYNEDNITLVDGNIVMTKEHHDALAQTLHETLSATTPISAEGLRIALRPMEHAKDHLTKPLHAQIEFNFTRKNIAQVLNEEGAASATSITTSHIKSEEASTAEKDRDDAINAAIWSAKVGVATPQIVETKTA